MALTLLERAGGLLAKADFLSRALSSGADVRSLRVDHGPSVRRFLGELPRAEIPSYFLILSDWASGVCISREKLLGSVRAVSSYGADNTREFLGRTKASGLKLFEDLSRFVEINHEDRVFFIDGVAFDPLLDTEPICSLFSYFEAEIQGGSTLEIKSLGIGVHAAPGCHVKTAEDLYRLIDSEGVHLYILDRLLYVVPDSQRHKEVEGHIREALQLEYLTEVSPLSLREAAPSPVPLSLDTSYPWKDTQDSGTLDLEYLSY